MQISSSSRAAEAAHSSTAERGSRQPTTEGWAAEAAEGIRGSRQQERAEQRQRIAYMVVRTVVESYAVENDR